VLVVGVNGELLSVFNGLPIDSLRRKKKETAFQECFGFEPVTKIFLFPLFSLVIFWLFFSRIFFSWRNFFTF